MLYTWKKWYLWQFQVDIEPTDRALVVQGAEDYAWGSPLQVPEDSSQWEGWLLHGSRSGAGARKWAGVRANTGAGGLSWATSPLLFSCQVNKMP